MSAIVITPANVIPGASASQVSGTAGETITAGMSLYYDTVALTWKKALAAGTALQSGAGTQYGIALCGASAGQPVTVDLNDSAGITIGGTTAVGTIYCVGATAGEIVPEADIATTNYMTILGVGMTGNKIKFVTNGASGIAHV
jgi:hypothetical protein